MGYHERDVFLTVLSGARHLGYGTEEAAEFGRAWAAAAGFSRPDQAALIGRAFIEPALRPRALELLNSMAGEPVRRSDLARFSLGVEDYEGAIGYLEQALADGEPTLVAIGAQRAYDPLRKDQRFARITEQLGVPNGRLDIDD